ncbi:cytochrome P450, partial [Rhizoctonia solani]
MIQLYAYVSVATICLILLWIRLKQTKCHSPLPPSPKSDPLIGNLRTMMNIVDEPRAYRDWGLKFGNREGDIISITLPGRIIIILNSQEAIDELLVKRSSIYSDRPYIPMISSERLFQRKMMHEVLQKSANEERWPLIERDSRLALQRIMANPSNFSQELRRQWRLPLKGLSKQWWFRLPGAAWKAKANTWRKQKDYMIQVLFEWAKNKMSTGQEAHSMLSGWLNEYMGQDSTVPLNELEDRIRWVAGGMFAAGTDTSLVTLRTFILAMAMLPDIQSKAQAQIDSAISTRFPELSDQDSLPYMLCIIKEVMRWRISLSLALPHGCIQDDTLGNAWAISNNPDVYTDPKRFNPDRFLNPLVPDAPAFGFGRRICPGQYHAEAVIFITTAGLLPMFHICPEEDTNGKPTQLRTETALNEVLRFIPRSEKHEQIVREWEGL